MSDIIFRKFSEKRPPPRIGTANPIKATPDPPYTENLKDPDPTKKMSTDPQHSDTDAPEILKVY